MEQPPSNQQPNSSTATDRSTDPVIKARLALVEQRLKEANLPDRYRCAQFSSCLAPKGVKSFFEKWSRKPEGILLLHGDPGRGKTYLAACTLRRYFGYHAMLDRECPGIYLPSDFPDQIRKATGSSTVDTLVMSIARLRGLVIMDDLGVQNLNDFVRDQIARIIYHRYDSLLPIMITCNFDLAWIATHLDTRIADRIAESNQVFKLDGPNRRLKQ